MSTSAEVICSAWSIHWRYISRTLMRDTTLGAPMALNRAKAGAFAGSPANPLISATPLNFLNVLGAGELDFVYWKCIDHLHYGRISITIRPQDYCYRLLGLSKEFDNLDIKVDYSLLVETVYR